MTTDVITIRDLSFSYGKKQILSNLNMSVPANSIYGLLGRNGAGKSTVLKLLLDLLPCKKGCIRLWDNTDYERSVFYRIGNMIETPAVYNFMTVEEHLKMQDILFEKGRARIERTLEMTGLSGEKDKKAGQLSTGLKQRLAIALALFRDPDLLILDEPVNGLDIIGIIEFREILLNLQKEGKTILLSSHIISEMEKLCTHIGILENGELKYEGKIADTGTPSLEDFYVSRIRGEK